MTNVLDGYKGGDTGGDVSMCNGWPLPAVGKAVAFRVYMRHGLDAHGQATGWTSNHQIQPGAGDLPYYWAWKWGLQSDSDLSNLQLMFQQPVNPEESFPISGTWPTGSMFIIEWSLERVTSSTWKVRGRVSDGSYNLLGSFTDPGTANNMQQSASNMACGSSVAARSLFVGWNGPGGWGRVTGHIHWGGVAVAITDPGEWIGAYPVGPEAN
jgi:hypothetical protein